MSLTSHYHHHHTAQFSLYLTNTHSKNPNYPLQFLTTSYNIPSTSQFLKSYSSKNPPNNHLPLRAFKSERPMHNQNYSNESNLDALFSIAEVLCLTSSVTISFFNLAFSSSQKPVLVWFRSKVPVWLLMVCGVFIGSVIRNRQWRRICLDFSESDGSGVNLVERIEKLEEDVKRFGIIVRALSRKLERLGIRFRVSRKALKEPIAKAIASTENNSEVTSALAVQQENLEKELGEIQESIIAMQDHQQKQFELICAIGENKNLFEEKDIAELKQIPVDQNSSNYLRRETHQ